MSTPGKPSTKTEGIDAVRGTPNEIVPNPHRDTSGTTYGLIQPPDAGFKDGVLPEDEQVRRANEKLRKAGA